MNLCALSQQFRSERIKKSLHLTQSKNQTQDDELNQSQYQNEYINKFIQYVSKSPNKNLKEKQDIQPPILLLKNFNHKLRDQNQEFVQKNKQDAQKKLKDSSVIQDYIELKKRQQILQVYMNEQKIMDSVQQKTLSQKQQNQEETQKSFSDCKPNQKNMNFFQQTHNNSTQNIQQENLSFYSSTRPVLTEQSSEGLRFHNQPNKCLRSMQKYLHQAQQQGIPQDIECEIQQLIQTRHNQENSKNKLIDTSIIFNNSALNHLIQPKSTLQTNRKDLKSLNQLSTTSTTTTNNASKPSFLERQANPNLLKPIDNCYKNLFDLRSTHVLKDRQINDLQINSSSQLNTSEMYSNQITQPFKVSFPRRNLRSYSQKTDELSNKNLNSFQRPSSRRYNADQEDSLLDSTVNEGSTQNSMSVVQKTRKQTINKLVKYFNTIADFKQESRQQIKMNRIESRNFVFSSNNEEVIQSYAQIVNKKQNCSSESEEQNSMDTTLLNHQDETFKINNFNYENSTVLSPIITDFSVDRIDYQPSLLENIIDSTEIMQSISGITSCTASPKIRPRYSIKNIDDDDENEVMKKLQRSSKKTIKTEDSSNKKRKLILSSSLVGKDNQKQIKQDQLINSQIFMNKSFFQQKAPKRKQKKANIINQSLDVVDQTKKFILKKKENKFKLNPIESKQNNNYLFLSQNDNNQNSSCVLQILKTIQ